MTSPVIGAAPQPEALTPAALSRWAHELYRDGPPLLRWLNRYRPYICPFEELLPLVPPGSRVLDVGCGGGLLLALLHRAGRLGPSTGFDTSRQAIALAQAMSARLEAPRPTFVHLSVQDPWPPGPWDVVCFVDVIHHVPPAAQRGALEMAADAVRPGGLLLYKDMTSRGVIRPLANRLHDLALARQWIHYVDSADVASWMRSRGLELVTERTTDRLWYRHELLLFRRPA